MYVADEDRVHVFTSEGEYVRQFGEKYGLLNCRPASICVDDDNLVYVGDQHDCVSVFTTEGKYRTSFGSIHPLAPPGIAVTPYGVIYVCDNYYSNIYLFN